MDRARTVVSKYKLTPTDLKLSDFAPALGEVAVVVLEARMLSVVQSEDMTVAMKRQKLQDLCQKVSDWSKEYGVEAKRKIHTKIMVEGVNKLLVE
eukprot:6470517-Amphidinium_carterae.1